MADLCDYELDVLRMLAGRGISLTWGAAMGAALEHLLGLRLVSLENGAYVINDRGLAALENPHA